MQWSHFVNVKDCQGCNIPLDLHMEHMNRRVKAALRNLSANVTPNSIDKIGKSIVVLWNICSVLKMKSNHLKLKSTKGLLKKDLDAVLLCLQDV